MNDLEVLLGKPADLDTLFGQKVRTSINVHGLLVPPGAIQSRLNRFGQNLVHFTHEVGYEIQLIGSATGLDYRGTKFLICTAHQLDEISEQNVGILLLEKNNYIRAC